MKQMKLFEAKKKSGLDSFIDPLDVRMAKVEKEIERQGSFGVPKWKILEYFELYGRPPRGNETI